MPGSNFLFFPFTNHTRSKLFHSLTLLYWVADYLEFWNVVRNNKRAQNLPFPDITRISNAVSEHTVLFILRSFGLGPTTTSLPEIVPILWSPEYVCCQAYRGIAYWLLCENVSWYDTIRYMIYDMIYDTIYLLTEMGLTPGGSSTVHIYTQTVHRTTQWKQNIQNRTYVTIRIYK